jgi:hypothetical protein
MESELLSPLTSEHLNPGTLNIVIYYLKVGNEEFLHLMTALSAHNIVDRRLNLNQF